MQVSVLLQENLLEIGDFVGSQCSVARCEVQLQLLKLFLKKNICE